MYNKYFWSVTIICCLMCTGVHATSPPMVERHVFTPAQESEKEAQLDPIKAVNPKELQRQVVFTGVIIGPKGKKVLVRETGNREPGNKTADIIKPMSYGIGDQIKGMTIKDIGSNYLILAGQEGETKLNLYRGEKARPSAPAPAPEPPSPPAQPPGGMAQPNDPSHPLSAPEPGAPGSDGTRRKHSDAGGARPS